MKQIIEVPHFVQYYNINKDYWKERSCGIASLAMVLDFYGKNIDLDKLIKQGLEKYPYDKNTGWRHDVIVELAQDYGLESRRTEDETVENLIKSLNQNEPVIISIHKNFDSENGGHLAVLCGYFATESDGIVGFYVNDPIGPQYKHKYQLIEYDKFIKGWKKRAIYISKKEFN